MLLLPVMLAMVVVAAAAVTVPFGRGSDPVLSAGLMEKPLVIERLSHKA